MDSFTFQVNLTLLFISRIILIREKFPIFNADISDNYNIEQYPKKPQLIVFESKVDFSSWNRHGKILIMSFRVHRQLSKSRISHNFSRQIKQNPVFYFAQFTQRKISSFDSDKFDTF